MLNLRLWGSGLSGHVPYLLTCLQRGDYGHSSLTASMAHWHAATHRSGSSMTQQGAAGSHVRPPYQDKQHTQCSKRGFPAAEHSLQTEGLLVSSRIGHVENQLREATQRNNHTGPFLVESVCVCEDGRFRTTPTLKQEPSRRRHG